MVYNRSEKKYGIEIIQSRPGLDIRNLNEIGWCFNANYLLCVKGEGNVLIAKGWKRKIPIYSREIEVIVSFK
mgnify:CR=1 FL=1